MHDVLEVGLQLVDFALVHFFSQFYFLHAALHVVEALRYYEDTCESDSANKIELSSKITAM